MRVTDFLSRLGCLSLGVMLLISCTSLPTPSPINTANPQAVTLTAASELPMQAQKTEAVWLLADTGSPSRRLTFGMTYASQANLVLLFGGVVKDIKAASDYLNDTWVFDVASETWHAMKPVVSPSPRAARLVYDSESDRSILYCSMNSSAETNPVLGDTWAYDHNNNTWTQMKAQGPANFWLCEMAYDSESDRIILFGGWNVEINRGAQETWVYDYNSDTWIDMKPAVHPPGQNNHNAMVYDSKADRVILWSEDDGKSIVWAYDYNSNTWEEQPGTMEPEGTNWWPASAYHAGANRSIFYGGEFGGGSGMWAYDYGANTWTSLNPSSHPGKLFNNQMVYISALDRLFLFGGETEFGSSDHAWLYDYSTNMWTEVVPKP